MTDKELKKLKRAELLQLLLTQSREIDRLRSELEEANRKLDDRNLGKDKVGSLAEASLGAFNLIEDAQKTADLYLENVKRRAEELLSTMTPENAGSVLKDLKGNGTGPVPIEPEPEETISLKDLFWDDDEDDINPDEDDPSFAKGVSG